MSVSPYGRGLVGLFRQGCHEIPEVMGSCFLGLLGIGLSIVGLYRYERKDGDNRRYKMDYVIMRSDDPRAARVHKD
uniref:Protein with signal anchor n=1 Tax=Nyssomyia neivai TaxID=330878 RepID=A0A1L8DUY8_9DIPT